MAVRQNPRGAAECCPDSRIDGSARGCFKRINFWLTSCLDAACICVRIPGYNVTAILFARDSCGWRMSRRPILPSAPQRQKHENIHDDTDNQNSRFHG